jgi:hypothetical protein
MDLRLIQESYNSIYYNDQNLFEDIVDFCLDQSIFDNIVEAEYFATELFNEDLIETFLTDLSETFDVDMSLYLEEGIGGLITKFGAQGARQAINALSKSGRIKAGITAGTAVAKNIEKTVGGAAASSSIRAARAARGPAVEFQKPGKYLDMLKAKRPEQGRLLNPQGKAYNFKSKAGQEWKGPRATDKIATTKKPADLLPKPVRPEAPGQLSIFKGSKSPTSPTTKISGVSQTARAVLSPAEKTGQMKYPHLAKYDTSAQRKLPGSAETLQAGRAKLAATIAGVTAAGTAGAIAAKNDENKVKKTQGSSVNKYNTMDPNGTVRSRLAVGPKVVGQGKVGTIAQAFDKEFSSARKSGKSQFEFKGKQYTTKLANEEVDNFDIVLNYLLDENFVETYDDAMVMMSSMSEGAISRIAATAIKNVIKSGGEQLSKIKLPAKLDPAIAMVKASAKKAGLVDMKSAEYKYAQAARQSKIASQPKPTPRKLPSYGDETWMNPSGSFRKAYND